MSKALLALVITLVAAGSASGSHTAQATNAWFPLTPGTTYTYDGIKNGKRAHETVVVTSRVKTIQGKRCTVVEDRLYAGGELVERTTDWYWQDPAGNVWYYGEATAELENGQVVSTEGSWQAGIDGASPGIFMPAHPRDGYAGQQEHYTGHAEDRYRVLGHLGPNALLVEEWNPLEPKVRDHKLYVRGTGLVLERQVRGGDELNELVSVRR